MIRVFTHKTKWTPDDDLSFIGWPPLFRPDDQPVKVSVTFKCDIELGQRLKDAWSVYYSDVQLGGPAFDDPGDEFMPGRFIKSGVTITSRGCSKRCPWCFVPKREGPIRELPIVAGNIIQDNNLLACSKSHIFKVFEMLQTQKKVKFSGGIDSTLLKEWHRPLFDSINLYEIWLACDSWASVKPLIKAVEILNGMPINKKRCYVMIGFNGETLSQAESRLEMVYGLDLLPFCQLYQGDKKIIYDDDWKSLARKWSRPAAYRSANNPIQKDAKQMRF